MTQDEFDRRFDRVFKVGFAMIIAGFLAAIPGALIFYFTEWLGLFIGGACVGIVGGVICNLNFAHDIFCNPRWKR
jgi:hypothetical protein